MNISPLTTLEVVQIMRQLLDQPHRWTKGCMARGEDGRQVKITHVHACVFSLEGSLYRVMLVTKAKGEAAHELLKLLIHPRKVVSLANFNDAEGTTHTAILNLLDRAITKLGGVPPIRDLGDNA